MCFNCDETYHIGHRCKKLFIIISEDWEEEEEELVLNETEKDEEFHISVDALASQITPDTIKLLGTVGRHKITVLVDTGSTHSFLDVGTAKRLGYELEYITLMVIVADGEKLECNTKYPKLEWEMGKCRFSSAMRVLRLGGCDMVVGVDLIRQLGPVSFDFDGHKIRFERNRKIMTLQGIQ